MPQDLTLILDSPNQAALPLHFRRMDSPFTTGPGPLPTRLGLDAIRASGGAQFSLAELDTMLANLPAKPIIIDLRQESHGFLNGTAVSWYSPMDFANKGKVLSVIAADEQARLKALLSLGRACLTIVQAKDTGGRITQADTREIPVSETQTEAQVAAGRHLRYLRLAVTDHNKPADQDIDDFLRFYREMPEDAWLHLHCHAGEGRTTVFLIMLDMLANAGQVSAEDTATRQHLLGGLDILNAHAVGFKLQPALERAEFVRRFHRYALENPHAKPLLWSEWLAKRK
jgi:predicted protein tyrosine phosphatase